MIPKTKYTAIVKVTHLVHHFIMPVKVDQKTYRDKEPTWTEGVVRLIKNSQVKIITRTRL